MRVRDFNAEATFATIEARIARLRSELGKGAACVADAARLGPEEEMVALVKTTIEPLNAILSCVEFKARGLLACVTASRLTRLSICRSRWLTTWAC